MINQIDYVELGLTCAEIHKGLDWELGGKQLNNLSSSVYEVRARDLSSCISNGTSRLLIHGGDTAVLWSVLPRLAWFHSFFHGGFHTAWTANFFASWLVSLPAIAPLCT